jgi:hypothetical protein
LTSLDVPVVCCITVSSPVYVILSAVNLPEVSALIMTIKYVEFFNKTTYLPCSTACSMLFLYFPGKPTV